MEKMHPIFNMPNEVVEVMLIQGSNQPVGLSTWERMKKTIEKYPEYFPWEHLYKSIPEEVHNAYKSEVDPDWDKPFIWGDVKSEQPEPISMAIQKTEINPIDKSQDLDAMIEKMYDDDMKEREKEFQERKRREKIWNKHYKKFNLPFRE